MSSSAKPVGFLEIPAHLEPADGHHDGRCKVCGALVTIGRVTGRELGHRRYDRDNNPNGARCPYRPAETDAKAERVIGR